MKQIGRIIYSYRKLKGLSQEKLADIVGVSPAAVSKWERNLSIPDVEMLCRLADYFEITLDDLAGRNRDELTTVKFDSHLDADRFYLAVVLLECCTKARNFGLFAMEEYVKQKDGAIYDYLKFTVDFMMQGFQKHMSPEEAKKFLLRYAESEKDVRTAKMVSETITLIASGENEEMIREILRSYLGRKYAKMLAANDQEKRWHLGREEMINQYCSYQTVIPDTGLLNDIQNVEDRELQRMLRGITDKEFVAAMAGASLAVRRKLFYNLSDRMILVLGEDLFSFEGNLEEVREAQRRILEMLGIELSLNQMLPG